MKGILNDLVCGVRHFYMTVIRLFVQMHIKTK